MDFSATEDSILALFEPYGAVENVHVATDRDTGRARGFAFVEMVDSSGANKAITALNGTNVGGRALNINEAQPKPKRAGGGSGGPRWGAPDSVASRAGKSPIYLPRPSIGCV